MNNISNELYEICSTNNLEDLQHMIDNENININYQFNEYNNNSLLHVSTYHINLVQYLISKGANVNIQNKQGNTPLHFACGYGYLNIIEYFLQLNNIEINLNNNKNLKCYDMICSLKYIEDENRYNESSIRQLFQQYQQDHQQINI